MAVGNAAQRVGKPFVERMDGDRTGRAFTGPEQDATDQQRLERRAHHDRELHQRPDDRHAEQHVARLYAIGEEATDHAGNGEQEEERGAQQAELIRRELQLLHDRLGGQADDDLVGEVDQHEEEDEGGDAPGALEGPILNCHLA